MGSNSKRFLEGEAVPTIFSFAPEPARNRWESSMSRAEKRGKKLCFEELFPAMKPVQAMAIRKTYKSSNILQKNALARSL